MGEDTPTGKLIREYRKQKGLTQGELGEKLGMTASTIMRYERGQRKVSVEMLRQIATALEIDPYSLMDWDTATEAISESINDEIECRQKILYDLDKLTPDGIKLVGKLVNALAGNPEYQIPSDAEIRDALLDDVK